MIPVVWVTHPRHLPKPPGGRVVVVDVAFAAGRQFKAKTKPFIEALGGRLVRWIDHHEHREAWPAYQHDPRFLLVPNKEAHACPELITPALVEETLREGPVAAIVAHCDFDGAVAAAKWRRGGHPPWPTADEDARAVDSPGRGHTLSPEGERYALAMDEATATYDRSKRQALMTAITDAMTTGEEPLGLAEEIESLAAAARLAEVDAKRLCAEHGREETPGVFVVRMDVPVDNRMRRNLLMAAEVRAPIGVLYEPDKESGHWLIAATFDESLDLEDVPGFEGGRSDYRFARAHGDGREGIAALGTYLESVRGRSRPAAGAVKAPSPGW